jgi:cytoskeletal protein CcmA (bactofilin family)
MVRSDPARAMYFKITSAGNLTATRTLTIAPNTISRVMFIENATSGSQSIAISQGSGASVTILTGKTAVVYLDGAGATAAVVDAMAGVDPGVTDTLTEVLVAGNTSGGTNIELSTTDKVQFRDAAIYLNSSVDGQLDIVADTEIQIAATTVDLNGNLDVSGTALVTGVLTTTAATVFNGGFASNADSTLGTDKKVQFRDSAIYINSSVDGQLDIVADTEIQIAATTIDINGAINASGEIIAASLDVSGDIDVDGTANLDVVDIDGAVDMASTLAVADQVTITKTGTNAAPHIKLTESDDTREFNIFNDGSGNGRLVLADSDDDTPDTEIVLADNGQIQFKTATIERLNVGANGDISFYEDTGTTPRLFWDSSTERLGIGTSSPSQTLETVGSIFINAPSGNPDITIKTAGTGNNPFVAYRAGDNIVFDNMLVASAATDYWRVGYGASGTITNEYLVVTSAGNVGIGTTSPAAKLHIDSAATNEAIRINTSTGYNAGINYYVNNTIKWTAQVVGDGTDAYRFYNFVSGEAMRIDASGNVGIGVVPSAWSVAVPALQLGICGAFLCAQGATEALYLGSNAYYNGTNWIYAVNAPATYYRENGGAHAWFNAPSGTTGDPITFTQAMTLDASGNLLVGKTTTALATAGLTLGGAGFASLTRSGAEALNVNRLSSDGDLAVFYKDSVAVGSIGSISGVVSYINLDPRSGGTGIAGTNTDSIIPVTGTGAVADGTKDLGLTTARWRNLYLSGGVYLGGTGAANKLDDYEFGTWTPTATSSVGTITSVTSEIGTYTKIGRLVTLQYQFNIATLGTASGNIIVSGMPFTEDNTEITYYAGIHRARSGTSSFTEFDPAGTLQLYGTTPVAGVYLGSIVYNTTS